MVAGTGKQVSIPNSGLVIDRAIDERGIIGLLKKAIAEDTYKKPIDI